MNCCHHLSHAGETDPTVKSVEPIKVYSEKELIREVEKIASILVPEKDWSIRIAAMQRIEGLVCGGMFSLLSRIHPAVYICRCIEPSFSDL